MLNEDDSGFAAMGDGENVIYVNTDKQLFIAIIAYFKPRVVDRIVLIKKFIEPASLSLNVL